jgi:thiamine biosynthesis lipoprotein
MGMPIMVDVCDHDFDSRKIDRVFEWLRFVDETFSTYRFDSQISRLNRGELTLEKSDAVVRYIVTWCNSLRDQTDGYFDAWRSSPDSGLWFDPSGLVKGWSIERAASILETSGARNFCLNAGGDIVVRGHPEQSPSWTIGVQHPKARDQIAITLIATDVAIATSGTYERGQHIVDPHTGASPDGVLSVTVAGSDLGTADAYATAIFAMGANGPEWACGLETCAAMVILSDGTALSTPSFDRYRRPHERRSRGSSATRDGSTTAGLRASGRSANHSGSKLNTLTSHFNLPQALRRRG